MRHGLQIAGDWSKYSLGLRNLQWIAVLRDRWEFPALQRPPAVPLIRGRTGFGGDGILSLVCDLNRTPIVMAKHGGSCVHFSGISTCGRTSRQTVSHPQRPPLSILYKYLYPSTLLWQINGCNLLQIFGIIHWCYIFRCWKFHDV